MIANQFMDVRQGNQRRQKLVQQIMGKYAQNRAQQQPGQQGALGGIRGGPTMTGTGMLNSFAKKNNGPNLTNPMSMSITKALAAALGPGGAGIPGAGEYSSGWGMGAGYQTDRGGMMPNPNYRPPGIPGFGQQDPGAPAPLDPMQQASGIPSGTFVPPSGTGSPFTGGAPGGMASGDPEHNAFIQGQTDVDPFNVGGSQFPPGIDPATGLPYDQFGQNVRAIRGGGRNFAI